MKYRIDFVTNSSSSSSVVVKIIMKDGKNTDFDYRLMWGSDENKFHNLNQPSYKDIHETLVKSLIFKLFDEWSDRANYQVVNEYLALDGENNIYINRDAVNEVIDQRSISDNKDSSSKEVGLLSKLDELLSQSINSYEDLSGSKVWELLGLKNGDVKTIYEEDELIYDETFINKTFIDVENLTIQKKDEYISIEDEQALWEENNYDDDYDNDYDSDDENNEISEQEEGYLKQLVFDDSEVPFKYYQGSRYKKPQNFGKRWPEEHLQLLQQKFENNVPLDDIALELGRDILSLLVQLSKQNIISDAMYEVLSDLYSSRKE